MKKIILLLLLVTSCGMYNSDGVYVNRYNTQVQFDSITNQYVIIKYIPIYKNRYNPQYYNNYYDMYRYPRTYRHQFNYNNNFASINKLDNLHFYCYPNPFERNLTISSDLNNIKLIQEGKADFALIQPNVINESVKRTDVRLIANVFPEVVLAHVRKDIGYDPFIGDAELRKKTVAAIGEPGSGDAITGRTILDYYDGDSSMIRKNDGYSEIISCLLYTSPSPRD